MGVMRFGVNLCRMKDAELAKVARVCVMAGVSEEDLAFFAERAQMGRARKRVVMAATALSLLQSHMTKRHAVEPSEESKLWSGMEGGHLFHESPFLDVGEMVRSSQVVVLKTTFSGG